MSDSTPEARIAAAEAAEERALLKLATAYRERNAAYKDLSRAAYREGGPMRQFDVGTRLGPDRHAKALVRRLRRLGLSYVLDHARVRWRRCRTSIAGTTRTSVTHTRKRDRQ